MISRNSVSRWNKLHICKNHKTFSFCRKIGWWQDHWPPCQCCVLSPESWDRHCQLAPSESGKSNFILFLQFLGYSSCLPLLLWLRSSRKTQWLRLIVQRPLCNICSFLKKKSYVPIKEQHCKHTEEMLFLADTYNTYLGNFQIHTPTKYKNTKKWNYKIEKRRRKR